MTNKSNAEAAHDIASICFGRCDVGVGRSAKKRIESALAAAQSDLAREVLANLDSVKTFSPLTTDTKDVIELRLRDLFSRLGISVDGGE